MAHVAGRREHDLLTLVGAAVVRRQRATRHGGDDVGATDHRPSQRMRAEDRLGGDVVHEVVRRVLDHRDLLEDDLAFGVDVRERRAEDHVRHHVERTLEPVVGDPRVDDGRLARRCGVQLAAELVEDLRDLLRRVARRALEEQVLDEVRDARARDGLVPGAGADPEPERDRAHARDALGDDALARRELGELVLRHAAGSYPSSESLRRSGWNLAICGTSRALSNSLLTESGNGLYRAAPCSASRGADHSQGGCRPSVTADGAPRSGRGPRPLIKESP